MTERKFFRVTTQGKEQLKSLNLNDVEMDTVLLALHGSLGSEIKKRGKITKGVLCETMMKIITLCDAFVEQIPCSGSASPAQIEQAQKETEDKFRKDLEEVKLTVAGGPKMTVKRMLSRAEVKKLSAVSTKLDDVNSAKKRRRRGGEVPQESSTDL